MGSGVGTTSENKKQGPHSTALDVRSEQISMIRTILVLFISFLLSVIVTTSTGCEIKLKTV